MTNQERLFPNSTLFSNIGKFCGHFRFNPKIVRFFWFPSFLKLHFFLVYQVLKEVGESFLVITSHDTRVKIISQKLPFLGEILTKLSIEVRDETKIDFLICIAKNNFNYISGYNPVLVQNSIRQMLEMFAKNEAMPIVGNFAKSNVENTRIKFWIAKFIKFVAQKS